ncbi:hypothetical protein [Haladaptatus sp. NG-SE-30]
MPGDGAPGFDPYKRVPQYDISGVGTATAASEGFGTPCGRALVLVNEYEIRERPVTVNRPLE